MKTFLALLLVAVGFHQARAGTNRFTAALLAKTEPASTNLSRSQWHPSGKFVSYLRNVGAKDHSTNALFAFEVDPPRERKLMDAPRVTEGTNTFRLSLSSYQWSPSGDALLLTGADDLWLMPFPDGAPHRLTRDGEAKDSPAFSPDGKRIAFTRTNNFFVLDVASGKVTQITRDGGPLIFNATLDWVYDEEFGTTAGVSRPWAWSPDSRRLMFIRMDDTALPEYPITDYLRTHPGLKRQRYPKAGDTNPAVSVLVADVSGVRPRVRTMPLPAGTEYVVPAFAWTPDGHALVMTLNRAQDHLVVHAWNPSEKKARVLFEERAPAWMNVFAAPQFLPHTNQFLWLSERDGFCHAWLYNGDGSVRRQLTRGDWHIEPNFGQSWNPKLTESDGEWIYFSSTEHDARERHVCRVRVDGTGFERLTQEPGTHFAKLSPDGRHLLESFSATNQPPVIRLRKADGTLVTTLEERTDRWKDYASATIEYHDITAPDGTKLHGQLTKPADFDPAKKYPVIVYVYGGPHAQVVRNQWPPVSGRHQLFAQDGFLIWSLDGRGSWGRGRAWENVVFKDCGTNELADQLAGVAWLRQQSFVDTNRLAVWGWSYGGYMTLYALTKAPDVFKCGIAGAPVTDWKFYDTIYTERYMRTPKDNPSGYKTSSPLLAADKLKAKLLLIHGTADDNVHMQNTMAFLDALTKAGKPYELQIQPGQKHGFGGEAANKFLMETMADFFRRNL